MRDLGYDLLPGDKVVFRGALWEVFVAPKRQDSLSAIAIFRYEHLDRASAVEDLLRPRYDLTLVSEEPTP
jgi:hypothetical protein